ncbi:MAG: hypothetical protein K1X88_29185 [Nannocystaceae bacterium]|nr:hypothetical protein [Nannocystaceae bacterium]
MPDELPTPLRDPLSIATRGALALFDGPLADVRFPGLDRDTLRDAAAAVLRAQLEVEALERTLDEARARTLDAATQLGQLVDRALDYAKVYSRGDAELSSRIDAVAASAQPRGTPMQAPRKRGRPRRDAATAELLPSPDDAH